MKSILAGVLTGAIVAVTLCRFIEVDAQRHLDEHLHQIEQRWPLPQKCWP